MTNLTDDATADDDPTFEREALFDPEHYLPTFEQGVDPESHDREAEFLASVFDGHVGDGDRVLDVPCGHGRHANRLAARGFDLAGLDKTEGFLERARSDAADRGVDVEYVHGDMRDLPWDDGEFAAAYNVFTSFGFFDEAGNRRVLEEVARVLEPGGRFVLELADRDALLTQYDEDSVTRYDDGYLVERREYDPRTGRNEVHRVVVHDGEVHTADYSVRLYSYTELARLLADAGFEVVEDYGDLEGSEYSLSTARTCLVSEYRPS